MLYKLAPVIDHVFGRRTVYTGIGISLIAAAELSRHAVVVIDKEQLKRAA